MQERIVFITGYSVGPIVWRVNKEAIIEGGKWNLTNVC
jgi:hypothetical protein